MDSPLLVSVREKIGRAQCHFDAINSALKLTLGTEPETESVTIDVDREGQQLVSKFRKVTPIDPSLPLMIGDCVHNLRSALDHLVYQLAVLNGTSKSAAEKTMFPICLRKTGPGGFEDRVRISLKPFISGTALAEVEKCQPYEAYPVPNEADIWILHQLDIIDKHRLLLVARDQFLVTQFWFVIEGLGDGHVVIPNPEWKSMEDGAEIIRFRITGGLPIEAKMNVRIEATRTVQLINTRLACDGLPVGDVLNQLMGIVRAIVRDFGRDFFGE
jgi:hypothetical protein